MSGTHICIAGWDTQQQQLVRPLLPNVHWTTLHIGPNKFQTGSIVTFNPTGAQPTGRYPHITEDVVVENKFKINNNVGHVQVHQAVAVSLTNNLDAYFSFSNPQEAKRYTNDGTQARSLGGIVVDANQLSFYETNWNNKPKLRCRFTVVGQQPYDFPVTSVDLRDTWRQGGLGALTNLKVGHQQAHLRTGLARGWSPAGGPLVCYAQLNNLLLI